MNSRDFLGNNFNDFFALPQVGMFGSMRSDIYKSEEGYILEVDMPGFLKEEIKMDYNNGYLIVEALKMRQEK